MENEVEAEYFATLNDDECARLRGLSPMNFMYNLHHNKVNGVTNLDHVRSGKK